ncbi:MAG: hypothetical protein QNJ30_12155 [Kiloniellales bacterium]|nr:hypothetical protein [Kiloniellales bacterium]
MHETVVRKGLQTSEFWLVLLLFAIVVANGTPQVAIPGEHIALLASLAFGYGGGRTLLKSNLTKLGAAA